jgi:hypothetical protein
MDPRDCCKAARSGLMRATSGQTSEELAEELADRDMINMEIIFCPNFEKKYGRLVKEIWSDFSVLLRKFPGFLLLGP